MKEHRLGFPKIGRDSRIDLRGPSYGARKVVDFRHFQPKSGGTHYGRTIHVGNLPDHKCVYLDWNCALGWVKKIPTIQGARNDVTKRENLSKNGTFKPFL